MLFRSTRPAEEAWPKALKSLALKIEQQQWKDEFKRKRKHLPGSQMFPKDIVPRPESTSLTCILKTADNKPLPATLSLQEALSVKAVQLFIEEEAYSVVFNPATLTNFCLKLEAIAGCALLPSTDASDEAILSEVLYYWFISDNPHPKRMPLNIDIYRTLRTPAKAKQFEVEGWTQALVADVTTPFVPSVRFHIY